MDTHRCDLWAFHESLGAAQTKQVVVCPQPSGKLSTIHDRTQMKHIKQKQMQPDFVIQEHFGVVRRARISSDEPVPTA